MRPVASVVVLPEAEEELEALSASTEEVAVRTVMEKLEALGKSRLPFPHQSAVRGAEVRELRPRSGRSRWRAFYHRRTGEEPLRLSVRSGRRLA